jgi:hypothetical protein
MPPERVAIKVGGGKPESACVDCGMFEHPASIAALITADTQTA